MANLLLKPYLTTRELGNVLGWSPPTVRKRLKEQGIVRRTYGWQTQEVMQALGLMDWYRERTKK